MLHRHTGSDVGRDPGQSRQWISGFQGGSLSCLYRNGWTLLPSKLQLPSSSPVDFFNKESKYLGPNWLLKESPSPVLQDLVKATLVHPLQGLRCVSGGSRLTL